MITAMGFNIEETFRYSVVENSGYFYKNVKLKHFPSLKRVPL